MPVKILAPDYLLVAGRKRVDKTYKYDKETYKIYNTGFIEYQFNALID
jgi:hypothetical protein